MEPETSYHAVVSCHYAADLHQAMCARWNLPDEDRFAYTSPNWLLILLDGCTAEQKWKLKRWRVWRASTQWYQGPIILESDCARIVQAFSSKSLDKSEIGFIIAEGKKLSQLSVEL
ncbi:hypothetical protein C2845_PM04G03400 [Panicum miliaceum]|uniref:RNase H type-1 domain-containing protein n=1 Tax=Panicum miliaceum TaxID=4540 RepID=A0A3L6QW14_PANMI|nr:hypothetical protein C2845_PM04G03400 [Panicum miliaceum]